MLDIGSYSWSVLRQVKSLSLTDTAAQKQPVVLAREGILSPGACQDFNAPPPFIKKLPSVTSMVVKDNNGHKVLSITKPNEIIVPPTKADQITIYSARSSFATIKNGLEISTNETSEQDGTITITPINPTQNVILLYQSRTIYGALTIAVTGWLTAIGILFSIYIDSSAKTSQLHRMTDSSI
jgi:hypothetical protein